MQDKPTFFERFTHPALNARKHQGNTSTFDIPCSVFDIPETIHLSGFRDSYFFLESLVRQEDVAQGFNPATRVWSIARA